MAFAKHVTTSLHHSVIWLAVPFLIIAVLLWAEPKSVLSPEGMHLQSSHGAYACARVYVHACTRTCIHAYVLVHTFIHSYIHTYFNLTHIHYNARNLCRRFGARSILLPRLWVFGPCTLFSTAPRRPSQRMESIAQQVQVTSITISIKSMCVYIYIYRERERDR